MEALNQRFDPLASTSGIGISPAHPPSPAREAFRSSKNHSPNKLPGPPHADHPVGDQVAIHIPAQGSTELDELAVSVADPDAVVPLAARVHDPVFDEPESVAPVH